MTYTYDIKLKIKDDVDELIDATENVLESLLGELSLDWTIVNGRLRMISEDNIELGMMRDVVRAITRVSHWVTKQVWI